jgi:endonuclease YncB( thermonuclease family)
LYEYFATYDGLRDADTIYLIVDAGFYVTIRRRPYRLLRINAPELSTDAGKAAKIACDAFLRAGHVVTCQTFKNKTASGDPELTFDRWLAEVWVDGQNLSDYLVAQGLAIYKTY